MFYNAWYVIIIIMSRTVIQTHSATSTIYPCVVLSTCVCAYFCILLFLFIRRIVNKRWIFATSTKGKSFFIFIYLYYIRLSCKWWTLSIKANQNTYNKAGKRFTSFVTTVFFFHIFFSVHFVLFQSFCRFLFHSSHRSLSCVADNCHCHFENCVCVCAHARDFDQ